MRATDLTLGLLVLLGGIGIYLSATSFRDIPGQSYGAGTMPRAIAIASIGVGLFIVGKALLGGERGVGVRLEGWVRDAGAVARAATVLALIVLYIVLSPVLGFTPTSLLVMTVAMLVLGTLVLITASPVLAEIALKVSSFEYFWLVVLGLSCAVFVSPGSPSRGLVSLLIGLFAATIGIENPAGAPRYTFGNVELLAGIQFIPAMIGLFAISEVIRAFLSRSNTPSIEKGRGASIFRQQARNLVTYPVQAIRGSVLGTAIGALPGAGADIAAWISYAVSKRFSRTPEKFGHGHVEGLVESGASNNAAMSGAWIPALVFGIPGDSITAIVIGVLYLKGINPGPMVFITEPQLIYAVFIVFLVANLIMLPLGWLAIKGAGTLLSIPSRILMPIILMFCIVGSFAINNSIAGIIIMLVFGVLGFFMEENDIPIAPAILGLVLGPMLERNFVTSMIKSQGSFVAFFERPIAAGLGIFTLVIWSIPLVLLLLRRRKAVSLP